MEDDHVSNIGDEIQTVPEVTPEITSGVEAKTKKKNAKPKNPQYFNEYYHAHKDKVACKFCGALVGKLRMCRHVKSKGCQLVQKGCHMVSRDNSEEESTQPRTNKVRTMEERMFTILDKYFETLSQKKHLEI